MECSADQTERKFYATIKVIHPYLKWSNKKHIKLATLRRKKFETLSNISMCDIYIYQPKKTTRGNKRKSGLLLSVNATYTHKENYFIRRKRK